MANNNVDISLHQAAKIAGFGLLIMAILAFFADFFVRQSIIMPGDAAKTVNNIMTNEIMFRIGIFSFLVVIILDVVVAWTLYVFLKPVNKSLSLLVAWFRLVYAAIFAMTLNNLFNVLQLLSGADYLEAFETNQLNAQIMLFLNAFSRGWDIGLAIFGIHLGLLGYLVLKSNYVPKILGALLIITGLGYMVDSFGRFLLPNYNLTIIMYTFIGELLFGVWLLWKGIKIPETKS